MVVSFGAVGLQLNRPLEAGKGVGPAPEFVQRDRPGVMRLGEGRLERDGPITGGNGLLQPSEGVERACAVMVGLGGAMACSKFTRASS